MNDTLGRRLLWLACRHHMLEVLLSDAFAVCFGPSSGPDIAIFKRFRYKWSQLNHHQPAARSVPLFTAVDDLKSFIQEQRYGGDRRANFRLIQEFLRFSKGNSRQNFVLRVND